MHRMEVDPATGLVEVALEGFWDVDYIDRFSLELAAATTRARSRGKESIVLCDYTRAAIQLQDVVGALQRMLQDPIHHSRRVACYTEGKLATMQARRVASVRQDMRVFDDRQAALAWLME